MGKVIGRETGPFVGNEQFGVEGVIDIGCVHGGVCRCMLDAVLEDVGDRLAHPVEVRAQAHGTAFFDVYHDLPMMCEFVDVIGCRFQE